jgi:hypothetical protein
MARRCQQGRRSRHKTAQLNLSASNERLVKRRARWKDSEGLGEAGSGDGVEIGWIDQEAHKASAGKGARKQVATEDDGLVPFGSSARLPVTPSHIRHLKVIFGHQRIHVFSKQLMKFFICTFITIVVIVAD